VALVETLADGRPRSIAELARDLSLTRQSVTKHPRVLQDASVLTAEHAGRETGFRAETETLACARDYLTRVAEGWDDALLRLKEHVETDQERLPKPSDTVGEVSTRR
jgi:DNA-binding transcriptional ArsR family regulator